MALREVSEIVSKAYAGEALRFGREYLIPKPFDPRLIEEVPLAVVKAAMASGAATRPVTDLDAYRHQLRSHFSSSHLLMQPNIDLARQYPARVVYAEGENDDVLLAMQAVVDEKIARPVLIGRPSVIKDKIEKLGLRVEIGSDIEIFNFNNTDDYLEYSDFYHRRVGRGGVSVEAAMNTVRTNNTVMAALMVAMGQADGMICGKVGRFGEHMRDIVPLIDSADNSGQLSSVSVLLLEDGPLFISDAFVNVSPGENEIFTITRDCVSFVQQLFNIEPVVALLSHSNFGTYDDPQAHKMRNAASRLRREFPGLQIEGEMNSYTALNPDLRSRLLNHANINGRANVLIMPSMDAASITLGMMRSLANARMIGPFLLGLDKSAHVLIPSVSGRGIFNLTALAVADIHRRSKGNRGQNGNETKQPEGSGLQVWHSRA